MCLPVSLLGFENEFFQKSNKRTFDFETLIINRLKKTNYFFGQLTGFLHYSY